MEQESKYTRHWQTLVPALLLVLLVLSACAQHPQSVGHLRRDAWSLEEPRSLTMNFLRFDYQIEPVGNVAGVKGWAYLDTSKVPAEYKWVDSLSFTVYLCEADGRVVAQDTRTFLPREARSDEGIAFEFSLRPEEWGTKPLFVSFGYRVVLTPGRGDSSGRQPFFVSEDAITR